MKNHRILNLGAGVQSTVLYLWAVDKEIEFDLAIFSDTGEEPNSVYDHVEFLKTLGGPEIVTVSAGKLGDDLLAGKDAGNRRFASIPAFMSRLDDGENNGIQRRQCTTEYKVEPIENEIRRRLSGPGRPLPKEVSVTQIFGLSFDEPKRVARVKSRFVMRRGWECEFPLFDAFITRPECEKYLRSRLPGMKVPRSACKFCPYRADWEWQQQKDTDPESWARSVQIDEGLRNPESRCAQGLESKLYLHRSCKPLKDVEFKPEPPVNLRLSFSDFDCEGMCGV